MDKNKLVKDTGRKAMKYRGPECLNCGHPLELNDKYCSYCSQLNTKKQLSLKDFFEEFIGSVFTYDSRLRYTIRDLLFKPGTITKNYVLGQRLKYANPFRFFLSVSILFFLIQSLSTTLSSDGNSMFKFNGGPIKKGANFDADAQKEVFNKVNKKLQGSNISNVPLDSILADNDVQIDSLISDISKIKIEKDTTFNYISEADLDTLSAINKIVTRFTLYREFYNLYEIKDASIALDSLNHADTKYNRWVYNKNDAIDRIVENPYGFVDYLSGKIPFFLFFFAPIFALFFWLIYSKKKYTYMEHLVFIFHIFSFLFLGLLICFVPDELIGSQIFGGILFGLIAPFYFYKSLRNFYKQGRLITIIKFVFLNIVFWFSSTIIAILFFAITAAAY